MGRPVTATPVRRTVVLVVDDDIGIQRLFRALLEGNGHQLTVASSGEAAVRLAGESPPAAVVLDYDLAGELNGVQVGAWLRERFGPTLPIIVCTSSVGINDFARAVAADAVLPKPFRPAELLATLNRLLASRPDSD